MMERILKKARLRFSQDLWGDREASSDSNTVHARQGKQEASAERSPRRGLATSATSNNGLACEPPHPLIGSAHGATINPAVPPSSSCTRATRRQSNDGLCSAASCCCSGPASQQLSERVRPLPGSSSASRPDSICNGSEQVRYSPGSSSTNSTPDSISNGPDRVRPVRGSSSAPRPDSMSNLFDRDCLSAPCSSTSNVEFPPRSDKGQLSPLDSNYRTDAAQQPRSSSVLPLLVDRRCWHENPRGLPPRPPTSEVMDPDPTLCFIAQLPDALLLNIFARLSTKELIVPVSLVCSHWRTMAYAAESWRHVDLDGLGVATFADVAAVLGSIADPAAVRTLVWPRGVPIGAPSPLAVRRLSSVLPFLDTVDLSGIDSVHLSDSACSVVAQLLKCCTKVQDLRLPTLMPLRQEILDAVAGLSATLQGVSVAGIAALAARFLAGQLGGVRSLVLDIGIGDVMGVVHTVVECCPLLERLHLSSSDAKLDGLDCLSVSRLEHIQDLRLAHTTVTDAMAGLIVTSSLRRLELASTDTLRTPHLANCPSLEEVHVDSWRDACRSIAFASCPKLRAVSLVLKNDENRPYVVDVSLWCCPALERLSVVSEGRRNHVRVDLVGCDNLRTLEGPITGVHLDSSSPPPRRMPAALSSREFARLESLILHCVRFDHGCVSFTATSLQTLELRECSFAAGDAELEIACPVLSNLTLSMPYSLAVCTVRSPAVRTVTLVSCPLVDDAFLAQLAFALPQLAVLEVTGCAAVKHPAFQASALRSVHFHLCEKLRLAELVLPVVEDVRFYACAALDETGQARVAMAWPNLERPTVVVPHWHGLGLKGFDVFPGARKAVGCPIELAEYWFLGATNGCKCRTDSLFL